MNKTLLGTLLGVALGVAGAWLVLKPHGKHDENKPAEEHKEESHVLHTNGQTLLKFDKEAQEHMGLKVAALEPATLKPEVKGYGRVLDPSPLALLLVEGASTRAALEASAKEFQRVKTLAADQNASARALEAAEAAMKRDQILADAAQLKLIAGWGKAIAGRADLPAFVQSLSTLETVLVRIDLPLGEVLNKPPTAARIAAFAAEDSPVDAQLLGPVPSADPQSQGQGFLCLLNKTALTPGAAVTGWLSVPGDEKKGVIVPRTAVIRHEGEAFVYVQTGDELFERKEVELHHPTEKGWFEDEGLKPGQKIVVTGAQQLLSEELKGQGGDESEVRGQRS